MAPIIDRITARTGATSTSVMAYYADLTPAQPIRLHLSTHSLDESGFSTSVIGSHAIHLTAEEAQKTIEALKEALAEYNA